MSNDEADMLDLEFYDENGEVLRSQKIALPVLDSYFRPLDMRHRAEFVEFNYPFIMWMISYCVRTETPNEFACMGWQL